MATTATKKNVKQWRFYRSNLETIVWNPKTNSPLADFSEGHYTTDDPEVADELRELGYVEIALDATEPPPDVMVKKPTILPDDFSVPIIRGNNETAGDIRTEAFRETLEDKKPSAPKPKSKSKSVPKKPVKQLKRRRKSVKK